MKIYRISELSYKFLQEDMDDIDEDEAFDYSKLYGGGEDVFNQSKIRPDSTKNIADLALDDGTVIGATAWGWITHDDQSIFSFDIAINEEYRGRKIGTGLIQRAIENFESERSTYEEVYGNPTIMRIEAVNVRFGEFLLREYGFKLISRLPDRIILERS